MLMNFGPINQRGGEKRLNVIFSRARHHMAVVSSIRHEAIRNDYNDGAAALKQFLRYAEHVSRGQRELSQRVLEGLNPATRKALTEHLARDEVVAQLAAALRERGHRVDEQVGQSRFRCDLAVRDDAQGYQLGILVDTDAHYANPDVLERYVSRPRILDAFGWRVVQVLSCDWLHHPEAVLDRIERALRGEVLVEADAPLQAEPAVEEVAEKAPPRADTVAAPAMRQLEFMEGSARKFWRVQQAGTDVTISFGRIGTRGQTQVKQFSSAARAAQELEKLVAEKLKKGYVELGAGTSP
jgi:predicted DNA-binding WGR domain protein